MDCMVQSKRVEVRLNAELLAAVDAWRRHEPDLPPRAEAIVRLAAIGLEATGKRKPKPEPKK
jgi:hypothetical protein